MSGTDEYPAVPPGSWIPIPEYGDYERWRAFAQGVDNDLRGLREAGRRARRDLQGTDLLGTMRALSGLSEGSHALGRFVQADLEAVRMFEEAGEAVPEESMVLFPPVPGAVRATRDAHGGWTLDGLQPRTVHPAAVDRALVIAETDEGDRMFTFRTDDPGVVRDLVPIRTIAPDDPNGPMTFASVTGVPVGTARWWAARAQPWDGLLFDAACWFGACVWLCRAVESTLAVRTDAADLVRVGRVDVWVYSARIAMRNAIPDVEKAPTGVVAELAARRAAAVTATTADTVIRLVALLSDPRVSREDVMLPTRVAQLQIALRRFDTDANLRALGVLVAAGSAGG